MPVSKVLVQQTRLRIFEHSNATSIDLKGWVANQNYFIDNQIDSAEFSIRAANSNYLASALANDCNRMSMAAIESICGVQLDKTLDKSGAWGIIRCYYASFFAVHSLLRMFGISCSQLEQEHVNKVYELANLVGKTGNIPKIDKGFYSIEIDSKFENVTFTKFKDSHRDTWGTFLALLDKLIDQSNHAAALSKHRMEVIDILMKMRRGITRARCGDKGNWLSVIRNSVNYQHTHGVWFPYEKKSRAGNYIDKLCDNWKKSPFDFDFTERQSDIEIFFEVSLMINSLFRELILACAEKAVVINPVFSNGSLRLLNVLRAT